MRKALGVLVLATLSLSAQGHKAATTHSNAPTGTPAASTDRDKGTDRASDVGKGKHKGLAKTHKKQSKNN
jgi:hypothetical protein